MYTLYIHIILLCTVAVITVSMFCFQVEYVIKLGYLLLFSVDMLLITQERYVRYAY